MSWEPFRIRDAKAVARQWVDEVASRLPGFRGAFFHGSVNWLADDAPLPNYSDIDVIVVWDGPGVPRSPGKFIGAGVMLDVSFLAANELKSADTVLSNSHLAGSFRGTSVIADPSGMLTRLQAIVSRDFAKRQWVFRRCGHARDKILNFLAQVDEIEPLHDQVISWLFGTGVTTHVLLVAGLRNPTVRSRYLAVRDLLSEYGWLGFHEELLELLGCSLMSRAQVDRHLTAMADAFEAAKTVMKSPFPFATDISDIARPIAIDGSQDMLDAGCHREAVFWIAVTYSRCQAVLHQDAPAEVCEQFTDGYRAMLGDLGIGSLDDLRSRADSVKAFLPDLRNVTEEIVAANPEIKD
jgi:hypothetical protein